MNLLVVSLAVNMVSQRILDLSAVDLYMDLEDLVSGDLFALV